MKSIKQIKTRLQTLKEEWAKKEKSLKELHENGKFGEKARTIEQADDLMKQIKTLEWVLRKKKKPVSPLYPERQGIDDRPGAGN